MHQHYRRALTNFARPLPYPFRHRLAALAFFVLCASVFLDICLLPANADPINKPNIVLIMADDMGYSDIGCYGSEILTPHLDSLGQGGVKYTQFYNTARCCPTRASLLTGLYPHQAGVGHMVGNYKVPGYLGHLNDKCMTIAEVLKSAGYRTMISGKWHVGENRPHWPVDRGFDDAFGLTGGGSNYWVLDKGRKMALGDKPYTPPKDGFYMTDSFTDQAILFLKKHEGKKEPFFLYVPYTSPHWPLHAWPEDIQKYKGKYMMGWDKLRETRRARMVEMGLIQEKWGLTKRDAKVKPWDQIKDQEDWDLLMAVYAAQIDRMDQGIGKIIKQLKEMKAFDNTLILFLADNGGCAENINRGKPGVPPGPKESFLSYKTPWANASNTPFRRYKHWVHEGGISTPLIAHWPKGIKKPGRRSNQVGHVIDLMATCVDLSGAAYPKEFKGKAITPLQGQSLRGTFENPDREKERVIYWEHEGNRAVRSGDWKLVSRFGQPWELYQLADDRCEMKNLVKEKASKKEELAKLYDDWAKRSEVVDWKELRKGRSKPKPRKPSQVGKK